VIFEILSNTLILSVREKVTRSTCDKVQNGRLGELVPDLPSAGTGQRARVMERIFTQQTLAARVIESDQPCNQRFRRSGLRIGNGLLKGDAPRCGTERNVRQATLFYAAIVAEA
jgi:hypothetical protein